MRDFDEFVNAVSNAKYNDTVAVCGEIEMLQGVYIRQSNLTICCNDTQRCALHSNGGPNLIVSGENVTLSGLTFFLGSVGLEDGGNLKINASGHHTISQCIFRNGTSEYLGGNLYVGNADSVRIAESIFQYGYGGSFGGGAAFIDTPVISIERSFFENNQGSDGGGVFVDNSNLEENVVQNVSFVETVFGYNAALPEGFLVTDSTGWVQIVNSYFEANEAIRFGGAGVIQEFSSLTLSGNNGNDNHDLRGICDDFHVTYDSKTSLCASVMDDLYLGPISIPDPSPAPTSFGEPK